MNRCRRSLSALALGTICALGVKGAVDQNPSGEFLRRPLLHEGRERVYFLHLPNNRKPARPLPVVFVLHGGGGADEQKMALRTGYNRLSDRDSFAVAYPSGIDGQWNDGRGKTFRQAKDNTGVNDVGFISSIIDSLIQEGTADQERIYVTGLSNGGMMTLRLGVELGSKLAAIAPVVANLPVPLSKEKPVAALSVLLMNGTEDPMVPWKGGPVRVLGRDYGEVLSTEQTVKMWVDRAGLLPTPRTERLPDVNPGDHCRVNVSTYRGDNGPVEVLLYAIEGGGHNFPGGNTPNRPVLLGRKCMDINGAEVIWAFFKKHTRKPLS